jgi:predicted AlkP superfamily phosphohydrolase/phosphomutase
MRRFGRSPAATEVFGTPRPGDLLRLRDRLLPAPGRIARLGSQLLDEREFDLAWFTFSASHIGGHAFWDLSQLPPDQLDERSSQILAGTLEELYASVDAAIGALAARLSAEDSLLLVSPVGMDVNTSRADLLPEMLGAVLAGGPLEDEGAQGAIWRLRGGIPPGVRRRVAAALPARVANELTARLELRGMDWGSTRAFAHPADNQGYVRFNLRGRERDGIVAPEEVPELTAEIERGLRSFSDPDGEPAVAAVEVVADRYRGSRAGMLPDLVVHWSERPATELTYVSSPRFGTVRRRGGGSGRSGNHTPGDAWAVVVPGSAAEHAGDADGRRLVDVAATVCELTGTSRDGLAGAPLLTPA